MYKTIFTILYIFFVLSINSVYGATARLPPQPKPAELANQEGCYVPELNQVLPYHQRFSPQDGHSCAQYICGSNNITIIFTCGSVLAEPPCFVVEGDLTAPYPRCCPSVLCP